MLPGEALSLQGAFSASAQVYLAPAQGSTGQPLAVLTQQAGQLAAQLPTSLAPDVYQVWVMDQGQRSASVYLNQARGQHFDSPDIAPGGSVRLFSRNLLLAGTTPQVRLVAQDGSASGGPALVQAIDGYSLRLQAPASLVPGQTYDVYVSNGRGGKAGETRVAQSLLAISSGADFFQLGVSWSAKFDFYQNVYNTRTDSRLSLKTVGDGLVNDLPAIQAAIDRASADGGGVVRLPAGTYKLVLTGQGGLQMRSRVVLQGAGKSTTVLRFGYGSEAPGWQADGHWGVLWDNVRQSGLADLTLTNMDNTGKFYNNMAGQGQGLFMQRIRFELNKGSWLWWANSDRVAILNSEFSQGVDAQAGYRGPLQLNGCQNFVVAHNHFTYAVDGLNLNGTRRGVFEDNQVDRDGSARWPAALRLVNHVLIVNFAEDLAVLNNQFRVVNGPAQNAGDGETILAEGGGPSRPDEESGTVSSATSRTLQDNTRSWSTPEQQPVVAIVRGPGMGQWRRIVSRTATTLTLDRPWEVVPQPGSRYAIFNWGARHWLVQGNTLTGNLRGIMLYHNASNEVTIVGNHLLNSGSIDLTPPQQAYTHNGVPYQQLLPYYDVQLVGNDVANTDGSNGGFIGVHVVQYLQASTFGTSVIGLEVRHNTLTANQPNVPARVDSDFAEGYANELTLQNPAGYADEQTPAILGSIFQDNVARNCDHAVHLNSGAYGTVVCHTQLLNSAALFEDVTLTGARHASVGTVSCPDAPKGTGSLPPVADPVTNPPIMVNANRMSLLALTGTDPNPQGRIIGFNLASLPPPSQGTVYVNNAPAEPNGWVPASAANTLSFQPASNYVGKAVFTYTATSKGLLSSSAVDFVVPVAAPLPVELVDFRAVAQSTTALLTWRTASETASSYFAIERSPDGQQFAEVGRLPSQGRAATYTYRDALATGQQARAVYYRLRQVDTDGTTAYSPTRAVSLGGLPATVQVYPNPATTEVRALLPAAGAHLVVYTLTGQPVAEACTTTSEGVVNTRQLAGGTYLLLVQPGTGPGTYHRFTKQ